MNLGRSLLVSALLVEGLLVAPVRAQASGTDATQDPFLDSLVEEALSKNPDVAAVQEAATAAGFRPAQARSLANPMASVNYTNDGWAPSLGSRDMTTLAFMWSQDLPFPGKRGLRSDIQSRNAEQVQQQIERVKLSIAAAVKRAYFGLILGRGLQDLTREQEEIWKQIEGVARSRYSVGQGTQQDVLRAQVEVTRIEQLRIEQSAEVDIRLAELNGLLNRSAETQLDTQARLILRPVDGTLDDTLNHLNRISPELKSAALGTERNTLAVSLARKEFRPDLVVQAGYMNRGGLDPMWQAGVGFSLPIYRKGLTSRLDEAEAQLRSSERVVASVRLQLRSRTQQRLTQLKATERIATLYSDGIVPQDRLSVESAISSYQTGKLPFIAVLEALTSLYDDRTTHLGQLANHEKIRASLEEASLDETSGLVSAGASGMTGVARGSANMGASEPAAGGSAGASGSMANP